MVCAQPRSIALNLLCSSTMLEIIQQVPSLAMQATYHVEAVTVQSALNIVASWIEARNTWSISL